MRFNPGPSFDLTTYHNKREKSEVREDPQQLVRKQRKRKKTSLNMFFE